MRYRELILLFHPDKMGSEGEQFASAINQAKELVWLATLIFWCSVHEQYLLISVRRRCGTLILGLQVLSSLQGGGLLGPLRERSAFHGPVNFQLHDGRQVLAAHDSTILSREPPR